MKRKDFFKAILGVTAAAVVAPAILTKELEPVEKLNRHDSKWLSKNGGYWTTVGDCLQVHDSYTFEEVLKIWKETGMIIYQV